jgi:hypothetical protein
MGTRQKTGPEPIPWDSPEVRPALVKEIGRAWAGWFDAVRWAPQITEAPAVVTILAALRKALEGGDELGVRGLEEAARRYLGEVPEAGGRRPDRARALDELAGMMDGFLVDRGTYLEPRSSRPGLTAAELADSFVTFLFTLTGAGPFTHELKRSGAIAPGLRDAPAVAAVSKSFKRFLGKKRGPSGEDLVRVGVRALGYSEKLAKHLYDFRNKRRERRPTTER